MKLTFKGGLLIGVLCAIWIFLVGLAGWYKDHVLQAMFWVVILIQIAVLMWALRRIPEGERTFGKVVKDGTIMSVIGGMILIVASLLFTTIVFPHYFEELRTLHEQMLLAEGKGPEQIKAELDMAASMQTPVIQAVSGFIGTVVTGVIASLVLGFFLRKKSS